MAEWTDEWRERLGRLANELMDAGYEWPADEIEAFARVSAEKEGADRR